MMNKEIETGGTNEIYPGEKEILVKCSGSLIFNDFLTRHKYTTDFTHLITDISLAINDFNDPENRENLIRALTDSSFIIYSDDITLNIDFQYLLPEHYAESIISNLKQCTNSSIEGYMLIKTGDNETTITKYEFKKIKTDPRNEIKCTGRLFFQSYRDSWHYYSYLTSNINNSIFHQSYGLYPNIFIDQKHFLVLRCHQFIKEEHIEKNMIAIEKTVQSSIYGNTLLEVGNRETGFKQYHFEKKPDWNEHNVNHVH